MVDKLTDIMVETSTLLVESTDSSCARHRQTHFINLFWMYSINLFLFRSRAQPPLFLHDRCPLVSPSAWGLVMPRAFARVRGRSQHQIFRQLSIVDLPRILLVLSRLVPTQARFLVLSQRSPELFSSDHHLQIFHEAPSESSPSVLDCTYSTTWSSSNFSPKFPVHVVQSRLF